MLEFFSVETLKAVTILVISIALLYGAISSKQRDKRKNGEIKAFFLLLVLTALSVPFIQVYIAQSNAKSNLTHFNEGISLICKEHNDKKYSVSKKERWSIKGIYFSKESILFRADKCDEL